MANHADSKAWLSHLIRDEGTVTSRMKGMTAATAGMTFVPVMRRSAWVLPPLWLACMIGTLLYGSKLAAAFLAVTVAAAYLPPGKVSCPPTSVVQKWRDGPLSGIQN